MIEDRAVVVATYACLAVLTAAGLFLRAVEHGNRWVKWQVKGG